MQQVVVAPDGAILCGSSQIIPYYSNLAAIGIDPLSHEREQRRGQQNCQPSDFIFHCPFLPVPEIKNRNFGM